jgi:pimeloyl-ACP methyl ester carboxylesterase
VLTELRGFKTSPSLDEARKGLAHGPSQAAAAASLYPDATVHWFDDCGHFPRWDQPGETVKFILQQTG